MEMRKRKVGQTGRYSHSFLHRRDEHTMYGGSMQARAASKTNIPAVATGKSPIVVSTSHF